MKETIAVLLLCLVGVSGVAEEGREYRSFTDAQGRSIDAKIVGFDFGKGKLQIERDDGKRLWVGPGIFSEADQQYIQEWIAADQMLSENNLRISFKKKSDPIDEKVTPDKTGFDGEAVHFEVILENRSNQAIENLEIEYRYFITVAYKASDHEEYIRTVSGTITVERIEASSAVTILTDPATFGEKIKNVAVTDSRTFRVTGYDEKTVSDEDLEGIWLRIHGPEVDGVAVIRSICYPEGLTKKVEWGKTLSKRAEQALQRGFAMNQIEFSEWIRAGVMEIIASVDEDESREISDFIESFYEDQYDPAGTAATLIAVAYYFGGRYDLSAHWLQKPHGEARFPSLADMLLAEMYSSAPGTCDGDKAVRQADKILAASTREPNAWELSILASAYARDGQYGNAVETQERALAALGTKRRKEHYQEAFQRRLDLYKAGKPYDLDPADPLCWYCNIRIPKISAVGQGNSQSAEYEYAWPQEDFSKVPYFSHSLHTWSR